MRTLIVAILVAGAAALPAAAAGPAPIKEPFTLLPCPAKPATTLAAEGCAEHSIVKSDATINATAQAVYKLLSATGRGPFVSGEKSWLSFRHSFCQAESSMYAGGSLSPVVFGQCEASLNEDHVKELAALKRTLSQH